MNCNIRIVITIPVWSGGKIAAFANKGEDYDGTKKSYGVVMFHVPDIYGKLHLVKLPVNDDRIEIKMYD